MRTRVSSEGELVLPAELRRRDRIEPGQEFEIEIVRPGEYRLRRIGRPPNHGLVGHLCACPVKGWFRPMDLTETTDQIQPPTFG